MGRTSFINFKPQESCGVVGVWGSQLCLRAHTPTCLRCSQPRAKLGVCHGLSSYLFSVALSNSDESDFTSFPHSPSLTPAGGLMSPLLCTTRLSWTLAPALAAIFPASELFQGPCGPWDVLVSGPTRPPSFGSKMKYLLRMVSFDPTCHYPV